LAGIKFGDIGENAVFFNLASLNLVTCSHTKEKSSTVSLWAGSDVNSPSPSSDLL